MWEKEDFARLIEKHEDCTHAIKTNEPNELGIYDLFGNVSEWCSDEKNNKNACGGGSCDNYFTLLIPPFFDKNSKFQFLGLRLALSVNE